MSRWSPAQEHPIDVFRRYTQQVDRWFDRMLDQWAGSGSLAGGAGQGVRWPALETFDRGSELVIHAEMPGMRRDDVNVQVVGDVLTIEGERSSEREFENERRGERELEGGEGRRSGSTYTRFYREITIPPDLDASKLRAHMEDGVLELTLPYREERRARRIEIEQGLARAESRERMRERDVREHAGSRR